MEKLCCCVLANFILDSSRTGRKASLDNLNKEEALFSFLKLPASTIAIPVSMEIVFIVFLEGKITLNSSQKMALPTVKAK